MQTITTFLESIKYFGLRKLYYSSVHMSEDITDVFIDMNAIHTSRGQSLIKRKISRKLITQYSGDTGHNINTEQFFLGYGLIHYGIVRNLQPRDLLCVGSRKGFVPAILALACKDNSIGHVHFVDAGYNQDEPTKHWSGIGFWKKEDPKKHFAKISVSDVITTYVMTTQQYVKKYPKKRYQYVYIDGNHSYEGVKLDYDLLWPKLDKGGFMIFHDITVKGYLDKGKFGVWKFWKQLRQPKKISFPYPEHSGLGIVQK